MSRRIVAWSLLAVAALIGCKPTTDKAREASTAAETAPAETVVAEAPEPVAEAVAEGEEAMADAAAEPASEEVPTAPGEPIVIDETVTEPRVLTKVEPEYTEIARKARVQGMVIVQAVIREDGSVGGTKILKGLPMGLDQQAVAAIKQWVFEPATREGKPVAVYYNLTVDFRLD